jgi:glucose/arabinose dehydrogenase
MTNPAAGDQALIVKRVGTGFSRPVFAASPPGDPNRFFVVEQHSGRVEILDLRDGTVQTTPFLTISDLDLGNEQGLLGLAFDPSFSANGHFYVNYTDRTGDTNVRRYTVSDDPNVANASSALQLLKFDQPQSNHNGGWLGFSPVDGFLYISSGDGGNANDAGPGHTAGTGNAQDITSNLLGKMLRIDPSQDAFPEDAQRNYAIPPSNPFVNQDGDDEIWAYGLRNPWRGSFDRANGDLYIGDVGQGQREEIDYQPVASTGGENYGWRLREGTIRTPDVGGDPPPGSIEPIHDYPHGGAPNGGFSVTGGYVYRGPVPGLQGAYFFADYVSNQIWSLRHDGTKATEVINWTEMIMADAGNVASISSFAEDNSGNLYVVSLNGDIFRVDRLAELEPIVPAGSVWKYLDDDSDQGTAWRGSEFNDATWKEGPAQLGYGEGDEATTISFGPSTTDRHETSYFRHEFTVTDPAQFDGASLGLVFDDGAAVYLNGTEIVRTSNLAPDAGANDLANFNNAAAKSQNENSFVRFDIDKNLLQPGRNVLAVEVHQHSRSSNDVSFDLRLLGFLTESLFGDLNTNGLLDSGDLDQLTTAIRAGQTDPRFDMNQDGQVALTDRSFWVTNIKRTWIGDANLDGVFDTGDLVQVFQTGHYEDGIPGNSTWSQGDWDGDGDVSTSDLVAAFQDGGYEQGPRPAPAVVPEPASCWASAVLTVGLLMLSRRKRDR